MHQGKGYVSHDKSLIDICFLIIMIVTTVIVRNSNSNINSSQRCSQAVLAQTLGCSLRVVGSI